MISDSNPVIPPTKRRMHHIFSSNSRGAEGVFPKMVEQLPYSKLALPNRSKIKIAKARYNPILIPSATRYIDMATLLDMIAPNKRHKLPMIPIVLPATKT